MNSERSTGTTDSMGTIKDWFVNQGIAATVAAKLTGMAAALKFIPMHRHLLEGVHPLGVPYRFKASFQFSTRDGRINLHTRFDGRNIKVGFGAIPHPDLLIWFKNADFLQAFFSSGSDLYRMILHNEIMFDGSLSYLSKFGSLAAAIQYGGKRQVPDPAQHRPSGPCTWEEEKAPPRGEPSPARPDGEIQFIDDPYLARYSLDDFPMIKKLLWVCRTRKPQICTERPRLLTEFMLTQRQNGENRQGIALRQARALRHILTHKKAVLYDDDLLLGTTTSRRIGVVVYPECGGTAMWPELLTMEARKLNPYRITQEDIRILDQEVFPFWMEDNIREWTRRENHNPLQLKLDDRFVLYFMWKTQAVSHTIADLPMVLGRGLRSIMQEALQKQSQAADQTQREFYQALVIATEGVLDYSKRLGQGARDMAAALDVQDPKISHRREQWLELARICDKVPAEPAGSLQEALQAIWILFLCQHQENTNAGLSIGRLDTWLQPFYQRDLEQAPGDAERKRMVERALELVCAFMLKLTDHLPLVPDIGNRLFGGSSSDQVITLGGVKPDGTSAVCDMTWIFLKATEMLRLRDPNMNARYAPGINSEIYLRRLCEVNLLTRATPSIHNDAAMIPALLEQGFPEAAARDWGATGCVEPTICGRHYGHTNSMMFNMVAPLEMALYGGHHPLPDTQIGPHTGNPRNFTSYQEFLDAYKIQLGWLIDRSVEANNMLGKAHQRLRPSPLLSALFTGPMQSGKDLIDGGALFNTSGTAMVGLTDVVDSLAAIQSLVFERRMVDFDQLLIALKKDFAGFDKLHAEIIHKVPKFGQDHELPRQIADNLMGFVYQRYHSQFNYRGGRYLTGYWSMSNHVAFGTLSGALPSGRKKGKAFTPGLTPSPLSAAALTDQIRAVASLDTKKMPNNLAFNLKIVPGGNESHQTVLDRMTAYVQGYFDLGGMQLQFNVVSTETLRQAMIRPDEYRDLLVRISGYNAYFVELNEDLQLELIERTEHSLGERHGT